MLFGKVGFLLMGMVLALTAPLSAGQGGQPWAWGFNDSGQLGDASQTNCASPGPVADLTGIVALAGGGYHSLALKDDGTVWAWGSGSEGQLGNGAQNDSLVPVPVLNLMGVTAIAGGWNFSIAVLGNGTVWSWGYNMDGELGDGTTTSRNAPVQVNLAGAVAVAAGEGHVLILLGNGTVWTWGANWEGQLGNGTTTDSQVPIQVQGLTGVIRIAAGGDHCLAVKNDGTVWAWGYNGSGQLGDGTHTDSHVPIQVQGLTGVSAVAGGGYHSLALRNDGTVWGWGNTIGYSPVPVQIAGLAGVTALAGGGYYSLALLHDGTVLAWGDNDHGELGDGTNAPADTPMPLILQGATAIAGGFGHSLAVTSGTGGCSGVPVFIAASAHATGGGGTQWRTDVGLINPFSSSSPVSVKFLPQGGDNSSAACLNAGTIAGNSALSLEDIVLSVAGISSGAGGLAVYSTNALVVNSRTYNQGASGTFGQGIPGHRASQAMGAGEQRLLVQLHENAGYRTNAGFLNVGVESAALTAALFDGSGAALGLQDYTLLPYEQKQIGQIFRQVTASVVTNGYIQISVISGTVLPYASVVDNATGDPTYIEPQGLK